jgi:hypothetical protein
MKLSGHLDLCGPFLIEGWLYSGSWSDEKIRLQVYVCEELIGECVADLFRADLRDAGLGDGNCGFSLTVPEHPVPLDFTKTRLRLLDAPVFLLPDQATTIVLPEVVAEAPGYSPRVFAGEPEAVSSDAVASPGTRSNRGTMTRRGGSFFAPTAG